MPAVLNVHGAVANPVVLNGADAHTIIGSKSVWLVDEYTATVPATVSAPVIVIETDVSTVTLIVPVVLYVKLVGLRY